MMTATEKIQAMMAESYERYAKALKAQTEANKYRANFHKGRYEAFRESLTAINNDTRTNEQTTGGAKKSASGANAKGNTTQEK